MTLILAVGQKHPAWVNDAVESYLRRFPADVRPLVKEIKTESRTRGKSLAAVMAAEAERIETSIPRDTARIALDEHGKALTTEEFVNLIGKLRQEHTNIVFLIGGPDGLDSTLKSTCDHQIQLSSMTLPHGMVRVLLAEQLYRIWSIANNHPYHRA